MMTKLLILALLVVAACVAANARVRNFDPSEIDGTWAAHAGNCVADRYARITFFNKGSSFVSSTYLLSSGESQGHMGSVTLGSLVGQAREITLTVDGDDEFVLKGLYKISPVLNSGKKLMLSLNNPGEDFPLDLTSAASHYELYLQ